MKRTLLSLLFVLFAGVNAFAAAIQIKFGSHTVDYVTNMGIQIWNSAEVELVNSGVVGIVPDSSSTWKYFQAYDTSKIVIDGGQVNGKLYTFHQSAATFLNGTVTADCLSFYDSTLHIVNGTVNRNGYFSHDSSVTLSGGTIGGSIFSRDNANVDIYGGSFTHIHAENQSVTTLYGRDFKLNGVSVGYGLLNDTLEDLETNTIWHLTGTLQNGQTLDCNLEFGLYSEFDKEWLVTPGSVYLVPEPATLSLLALGSLAMLRRRK